MFLNILVPLLLLCCACYSILKEDIKIVSLQKEGVINHTQIVSSPLREIPVILVMYALC